MAEVRVNSVSEGASTGDGGRPSPGSSGAVAQGSGPARKKEKSKVRFYIAIALTVAAGGIYFALHPSASSETSSASNAESTLALDTFVVNLDAGQHAYLRVGITLGLSRTLPHKRDDVPVASLRDAILAVLASAQPEQLMGPEGKQKLKADLLQALQERAPGLGIENVYFTEFLVQM